MLLRSLWGHFEVIKRSRLKKLRAQCSSMHKLANKKKIRPLSLFKVPKATCIKSVLWNILRLVIFWGFWPQMTSDDLKIPFSHFQWVTLITSFRLICNMPMFLEEKCRSFWKSLQVFRSHLKSFGSLKSLMSVFIPKYTSPPFKQKKISLLALFLVPKPLLQS